MERTGNKKISGLCNSIIYAFFSDYIRLCAIENLMLTLREKFNSKKIDE
jgi:hypothetical protein